MKIVTAEFHLETRGDFEVIDITDQLAGQIKQRGFQEGQMTVFLPGSTGGITTIEYEPGLIKDLEEFFERAAPKNRNYHHEETWHDGNGHSHIRSSLLKTQLTIPVRQGKMILGTWQQVIFVEFDNKPRHRHIIIQLLGM